MKRKLVLMITGVLMVLAALVVGCGQEEAVGGKKESITLKVGVLPVEDTLPLAVAEQNGYFAEQNLNVELVPFQSAVERDSALQSGQLDGTITDLVGAALLRDSGMDIKIASLTLGASPEEGRFAILAAPGKRIEKISDLKGKSIGISQNSIIEYVTDGLLKQAGLDPKEVQKTMVPKIPVRLEMLLNGQLDAATLPDPFAAFAEFKGLKIIASDTTADPNLSQVVLVLTGQALQDKAAGVKRFFKAYGKAVEDINSSPEKYRELLVEKAQVPEPIKNSYKITVFPRPQLPEEQEVENVLQWLKEKSLLKNEITYQELVQNGLY